MEGTNELVTRQKIPKIENETIGRCLAKSKSQNAENDPKVNKIASNSETKQTIVSSLYRDQVVNFILVAASSCNR